MCMFTLGPAVLLLAISITHLYVRYLNIFCESSVVRLCAAHSGQSATLALFLPPPVSLYISFKQMTALWSLDDCTRHFEMLLAAT